MYAQTYRLTTPTLGILNQAGHKTLITIPVGGMIDVEMEGLDANRLVDVHWQDKTVMMFAIDLRDRGELVTVAGA